MEVNTKEDIRNTESATMPIEHLKQAVAAGDKHWYVCLLEAIALWTLAEETCDGRSFQYLIAGQAFDWKLLAERLCMELDGLVPEDERMNLMFGYPPIDLSDEEFKSIIGNEKYQAHLNFFYGILVERVLHLVVQLELDKEKGGGACKPDDDDELFARIYGASEADMIERFRQENGSPPGDVFTLTEFKQFTYWLFKFRVANSDSSRLASDTKKALKYLDEMLAKAK